MRLDPTSSRLYLRVVRENGRKPLSAAEVIALSSYVGVPLTKEERRLQRFVQDASKHVERSPYFRPPGPTRPPFCQTWSFFPYQLAGVAYFLEQLRHSRRIRERPRVGIFDPMGLGKTGQGVGALLVMGRKALPAVVVCPMPVMPEWRAALRCFTQLAPGEELPVVLNPSATELRRGLSQRKQAVFITHYQSPAYRGLKKCRPFGLLVLDEAHEIRKPEGRKAAAARVLNAAARATLLMTGTPALRSALEVLPLLRLLEGKPLTTDAEFHAAATAWSKEHSAELFQHPDRLPDVVFPQDAAKLEKRLRSHSVRRSRRAVRERQAAPPEFLPQKKRRSVHLISPTDPNLGPTLEAAWTRFEHLSEQALDQLLYAEDGFRTMRPLANALAKYEKYLAKTAKQAPTQAAFLHLATSAPQHARVLKAARKAYLVLPHREDGGIKRAMGQLAAAYAPRLQAQYGSKGQDLVFFTFYVDEVTQPLARALSQADCQRDVYAFTSKEQGLYRCGKRLRGLKADGLKAAFAQRSFRPKTAIISDAAKAGISLPSATTLIMLDRHYSPALEDQIEDRINRAGRQGSPHVVYVVPEDIFGYALAHRLENRRLSLSSLFGETAGSNLANALRMPRVAPILAHLKKTDTEESEAQRIILENYLFIENPQANLRARLARAWKRELDRRVQKEERQAKGKALARILATTPPEGERFPLGMLVLAIGGGPLAVYTKGSATAVAPARWRAAGQILSPKGKLISHRGWKDAQRAAQTSEELTEAQYAKLLEIARLRVQ